MTKQEERLGTEKPGKLILSLAIPAAAAQLINVLYNIVDRMYIGHIPGAGTAALTGVGVTFPVIMLISAFSAFAGAGGAPLASIALGRGDRAGAERILGNAATLLTVFAAVLTALFAAFMQPVLYLFGASAATIGYATDYLSVYLVGTFFVQYALGLNMFISCQGRAKTAMLSVLIGAVLNIALDPVFIFALNMGVRGAALATIISQAASAAWVVKFLCSDKSGLRIRRRNLSLDGSIVKKIMGLGVSPFIMQATESLIIIVLNSGLQRYGGDLYVGSMTILQSVMQFVFVPVSGLTQGTQPIISYNYGAGNPERVKKTFRIVLAATVSLTVASWGLTALIPGLFARIFTGEAALIALVERVMPVFMGGFWIFGVQMACQSAFVGLGQAKISLFLAMLRKIILLIPLSFIFPLFWGVDGIYWAEPVADITAAITTGTLFLCKFNSILGVKKNDCKIS